MRVPASIRECGSAGSFANRLLLKLPLGRAPPQGSDRGARGRRLPPAPSGFDERTLLRRAGVHVVLRDDRLATSSAGAAASAGLPTGCGNTWRAPSRRASTASGARCSRASSSATTAGSPTSCGRGSARRGSTTCSRCRARTWRSSPAARSLLAWLLGLPRLVGRARSARVDRGVRARGRRAAVGRPRGHRRRARLAGLADRARARPLVLPAARRARAARRGTRTRCSTRASSSRSQPSSRSSSSPRGSGAFSRATRCRDVAPRRRSRSPTACGVATAPILWLQFHALAAARDARERVGGACRRAAARARAVAAAVARPLPPARRRPRVGERLVRGVPRRVRAGSSAAFPGAQVRSTRAAPRAPGGALLVAAYAWRRWRPSSSPST